MTFYFINSYISLRPKRQKKTLEKFCQDLIAFHCCGKKCHAQSTREVPEFPAFCLANLPNHFRAGRPLTEAEQEIAQEVKLTFGGNLKLLVKFDSVTASILYQHIEG